MHFRLLTLQFLDPFRRDSGAIGIPVAPYLWEEYQKALKTEKTITCQVEKCKRCGVC